jgi:hypothetical protein
MAQAHGSTMDEERRDLAWHLFQEHGFDLGEAEREAAAIIADVLAYAADWDMTSAAMAPATEPEPVSVAKRRAVNKALYQLAIGVRPLYSAGAWLVPSGTRAGVVHRITLDGVCSCEAGQHGRPCWHVEAIMQQQTSHAA